MTLRLASVAATLAVLASGCAHFECTAHGGREVRELKTEHFVVTSDLPAGEHRAEAERLELLWDTFAAFFHADVASASVPVVVLSDTSDVDAFAPGYSGFVMRRGPSVVVVGAPAEPGQQNVNAHELTHLVSAFMLPRQPRWIAEGLATYFEDATFKDARTVKMGRWNKSRAEEAFVTGVMDLEELSAWGGLRFDDSELRLYASAWAWIHYLANHDEARLARLFDGLRSTKPMAQVMREVFPPEDAARLKGEIKTYLGEARFRGYETSLNRKPVVSTTRVLEPWQVHLLRSRLFLKDDEAGRRELQTVLAIAPAPAPAAVAVVKAKLEKSDVTPLVASFPSAPEVLVAAHEAGVKVSREALVAAAREATDAALILAAAEACVEEATDEAEKLAERGLTLAPWSAELASVLVKVSLAGGRCDDAELRLARVEALGPERPTPSMTKYVEQVRESIAKCRARTAR